MANKITKEVLESFLNCKTKAHLKLAGQQGTKSDYERLLAETRQEVRQKATSKILSGAIGEAGTSPVMAGFYNTSPADLDLLTREACDLLGKEPMDFTGSLVGVTDGAPSDDCSVVSPSWVERMANISDGSVDLLAQRWIAALAEEYPGAALDEEELGRGLHDLIEVCRKAVEDETDVVFVWT